MGWLCLSRVATQAGCKSFASLPLRKFSICHQFRSNQRPQSGVRTLFNVSLEFLNSRLSGNSGAIGLEAMEAKGFEIKGVHGVEQPRSKWQDVRLLDFFRIFCLSHPSDRDYTLSTLKRQESKFSTFYEKVYLLSIGEMTGSFNCSITWKDGGGMKQDFDRSSKKERGSYFFTTWNEVCRSFAAEAIRGGLVWGRKAEICSFRCLPTKVQGREHFGDRPGFSAQAQI